MKKLFIIFILTILTIVGYGQNAVRTITVPHNTTMFGQLLSDKTLVICTDSNAIYQLTEAAAPIMSLSTTDHVLVTSAPYSNTLTWLNPIDSIKSFVACASADSAMRYIALTTSGGWTKDYIYECNGISWTETIPIVGNAVVEKDSGKVKVYTSTGWIGSTNSSTYWAASGTDITNTNAGKVGIGMTPTYAHKLQVQGNILGTQIQALGGFTTSSSSTFNSSINGNSSMLINMNNKLGFGTGAHYGLIKMLTSDSLLIGYNSIDGTSPLKIYSTGRVKIGDYYMPKLKGSAGQSLVVEADSLKFANIASDSAVYATQYDLITDTNHLKTTGDIGYGDYTFNGQTTITDSLRLTKFTGVGAATDSISSVSATGVFKKKPVMTLANYFTTHSLTVGILTKTVIDSNNVTIDSLVNYQTSSYFADEASLNLTASVSGWGTVYADSLGTIVAWVNFYFNADGTVSLINNSSRVVNTDTDHNLCIFDGGSYATIRNRLDGVKKLKIKVNY